MIVQFFITYFHIIKLTFLKPSYFAHHDLSKKSVSDAIKFFLTSIILISFFSSLINSLSSSNINIFFYSISEAFILIPLCLFGLFFLTITFFLTAKVLGGKANLKQTFCAVSYSSGPLVFLLIPTIGITTLFFLLYLLAINLQKVHSLPILYTSLLVVFPFLPVIIIVGKSYHL